MTRLNVITVKILVTFNTQISFWTYSAILCKKPQNIQVHFAYRVMFYNFLQNAKRISSCLLLSFSLRGDIQKTYEKNEYSDI